MQYSIHLVLRLSQIHIVPCHFYLTSVVDGLGLPLNGDVRVTPTRLTRKISMVTRDCTGLPLEDLPLELCKPCLTRVPSWRRSETEKDSFLYKVRISSAFVVAITGNVPVAHTSRHNTLVAVSYRAGGDVIRALVQAHPEGAAGALHTACAIGCSADGIRALANEHSVAQRDGTFRQTPLELLNASKHMCRYHARLANLRHIRERQAVLRRSGASDTEADLERFEASVRREVEEWDFFDKAAVLIQTQYKGRALQVDEDETIQIVHACADIANCPPSLLELAILLHPEQLLEQDEEGQVPLHIAIPTSCCSDVIAACPEAARIVNHKGKYPLQIAVEVGRTWNEGVGALVAIHPVVVEGLDLDERLYPLLWSKLHSVDTAASLYASIRSKPTLFDVH